MKLGTKSQYAVMAIIDLAQNSLENPVSLTEISERQNLPLTYLEQLFVRLRRKGLVKSLRGQKGGYQLALKPQDITVSQVIDAVEEQVKITRCEGDSTMGCQGTTTKCATHTLWNSLSEKIYEYLNSITLEDVYLQRLKRDEPAQDFLSLEFFRPRGCRL